MYASDLDQEEPVLEFPFDPRRKYNQAENYSSVNWLEYPYKEVRCFCARMHLF